MKGTVERSRFMINDCLFYRQLRQTKANCITMTFIHFSLKTFLILARQENRSIIHLVLINILHILYREKSTFRIIFSFNQVSIESLVSYQSSVFIHVQMPSLLIFLIITLKYSFTYAAHCTLGPDGWCTFYGVWVTETHGLFNPTTEDPDAVINIKFENSRMSTLSNEICDRFPNLKRLELKNLSMEKIEKGALDHCFELHTIGFWNNKIKDLDKDVFQYNSALEAIHLQNNRVERIDPETFEHLNRLSIMDFSENYLTGFPVYKMKPVPSLKKLFLDSNEIMDLDEEQMVQKFPNLDVIYMNDNPFDCSRLRIILDYLKKNKIKITRWGPQYRHYGLTVQGEADCSDETKIAAIKDETMWIRKQTEKINTTLVHDVNELKKETVETHKDLEELNKTFNETAKDLSKGINHTQEELITTNRQLTGLKREVQKFKKEEMDRDNKIMKNVSTIETKMKNLQGQTDKNQAALSETIDTLQNIMKELNAKLDKIKAKVNVNNNKTETT